jgi:hypothetical protein
LISISVSTCMSGSGEEVGWQNRSGRDGSAATDSAAGFCHAGLHPANCGALESYLRSRLTGRGSRLANEWNLRSEVFGIGGGHAAVEGLRRPWFVHARPAGCRAVGRSRVGTLRSARPGVGGKGTLAPARSAAEGVWGSRTRHTALTSSDRLSQTVGHDRHRVAPAAVSIFQQVFGLILLLGRTARAWHPPSARVRLSITAGSPPRRWARRCSVAAPRVRQPGRSSPK